MEEQKQKKTVFNISSESHPFSMKIRRDVQYIQKYIKKSMKDCVKSQFVTFLSILLLMEESVRASACAPEGRLDISDVPPVWNLRAASLIPILYYIYIYIYIICTLFCLVHIKKLSFLTSCVC